MPGQRHSCTFLFGTALEYHPPIPAIPWHPHNHEQPMGCLEPKIPSQRQDLCQESRYQKSQTKQTARKSVSMLPWRQCGAVSDAHCTSSAAEIRSLKSLPRRRSPGAAAAAAGTGSVRICVVVTRGHHRPSERSCLQPSFNEAIKFRDYITKILIFSTFLALYPQEIQLHRSCGQTFRRIFFFSALCGVG